MRLVLIAAALLSAAGAAAAQDAPADRWHAKAREIYARSIGFQTVDGGPYPAFSSGPIHTVTNTTTWVKGRHTFKAGLQVEYSGEDDFDQINVSAIPGSTNNQNGRFEFLDTRAGGTED